MQGGEMAERKDYAKIAAAKIHKPGGGKRKPRFLIYGRNKKGKTRFCTTIPNVLILDPETGTEEETRSNPDVWPVTSWDDMHDAYMFLRGGGKSPITNEPYQWVAVDGTTKIANMGLRWVMNQEMERDLTRKPGQVGKQDYGRSGEMFKGMLDNLHSLKNLGIIFTAQERMIEIEDPAEVDEEAEIVGAMFVPDLPKGARGALNSVVDLIGRIYTVDGTFTKRFRDRETKKIVEKEVTGIQRRLWVGPHPSYDTGYRSAYTLPNFIPDPTIPSVVRAMKEGK
jgi:hypothetical protein